MYLNIQNLSAWVEPKPSYASLVFQLSECLLFTFMWFFSITWKTNIDISKHIEIFFCKN